MIRALFDTNVLASGFATLRKPESVPGSLIRCWRRSEFTLVVSDHILIELQRTLTKTYFAQQITIDETAQALWTLRHQAEVAPIVLTISGEASHPDDDLVLAATASAHVDFLVTGDRQLQKLGSFRGTTILSPASFLLVLESSRIPPKDE